jgi:hypothetical protein
MDCARRRNQPGYYVSTERRTARSDTLVTTAKGSKRMSMFKSTYDLPRRTVETPHVVSIADDAMLRAIGALVLLGIGAMHFLQIVSTFQGTPLLGVAYVVLIAACLAVAARLIARGDRRTWIAAGVVSAGAIGGYIFTRALSTPLDNQDVGNWSCMLGLAALFVETSLFALSAYATATRRALIQAVALAPVDVDAQMAAHGAGSPRDAGRVEVSRAM